MKLEMPFTGPSTALEAGDTTAAPKAVEKNGGKAVIERMPVGDIGFAGHSRDSEGNIKGVFEPARKQPRLITC